MALHQGRHLRALLPAHHGGELRARIARRQTLEQVELGLALRNPGHDHAEHQGLAAERARVDAARLVHLAGRLGSGAVGLVGGLLDVGVAVELPCGQRRGERRQRLAHLRPPQAAAAVAQRVDAGDRHHDHECDPHHPHVAAGRARRRCRLARPLLFGGELVEFGQSLGGGALVATEVAEAVLSVLRHDCGYGGGTGGDAGSAGAAAAGAAA
jgi:hypothetical protein